MLVDQFSKINKKCCHFDCKMSQELVKETIMLVTCGTPRFCFPAAHGPLNIAKSRSENKPQVDRLTKGIPTR